MKILWLCNIILPQFASEFDLKPTVMEGWIEGMLHQMEKSEEIALCFPIIDVWRKKDGELNGHRYYSFSYSVYEYSVETEERFADILNEYRPDIVHIWGTEYPHTLAMVNACEKVGLLDKVVVNIQGFIELCSLYYLDHIPDSYLNTENGCGDSLRREQEESRVRGHYEREALQKVKRVIGRTDWDYAWVKHINPDVIYHFGGEILRDEFYRINQCWSYEECEKHSIFVSQAGYTIKGLDYLLHALPDIIQNYPDTHVYVAGRDPTAPNQRTGYITPYGIYLKKIIDDLNLQDKVFFVGRLNSQQMIEMNLRANVFVSCSRIENSSNAVCEAALIGTPIVASYVGGIKNLAERITNIYLYQPGAEYMLAYYIRRVFGENEFVIQTNKMMEFIDRQKNMKMTWEVYRKISRDCTMPEVNQ